MLGLCNKAVNMLEFDANGVATKVDYLGITDFQDYLVDGQSSVVPVWAWVAGAAGLIGIAGAAAGGGGSDHSDNGDKTGPKITHDILDNNKIKITANEASQIIISDSTGKIIGTGQLNQAGHIDITLTRPLQDNETITVTATDNSGNKTIETFNVGDVTAPIISAEIQDATHVDIISNESGTVKITDSKGNVIGDGTLTGNGTVENIQLDRPLIDGETITVTVTDPSGNPKELEVTVGDVTTPKFINAEVNAAGELVLHYSEGLDATKPPSADQFTVTVGGTIIDPSNIIVTMSGTDVTLSFVPPIYKDQDVSIAYKDKTTSDDDVAIQDAAGNDAADLVTTPVDNNGSTVIPPDITPPEAPTAVLNADTGISVTDGITKDGKINVSGVEAGASIEYSTDGGLTWTPTALTNGGFTLTSGAYSNVQVRQIDIAGNTSPAAILGAITVDTTLPSAPIILGAEDNVGTTGNLYSGSSTDDSTPKLFGTAEANSEVTIYVDGVVVGTTNVDSTGHRNYTPNLSIATPTITATTKDISGNVSAQSQDFNLSVFAPNPIENPITALRSGTLLGLIGLDALGLIK